MVLRHGAERVVVCMCACVHVCIRVERRRAGEPRGALSGHVHGVEVAAQSAERVDLWRHDEVHRLHPLSGARERREWTERMWRGVAASDAVFRPSVPRRWSCPVDTPAAGGGATERESTSENSRSTDPTVSAENPPSSARGYFVVSTCVQRASCGEREAGKRYVQRCDRRLQRATVVDDAHVDDEVRAKRDSLDEELFGFVAVWR